MDQNTLEYLQESWEETKNQYVHEITEKIYAAGYGPISNIRIEYEPLEITKKIDDGSYLVEIKGEWQADHSTEQDLDDLFKGEIVVKANAIPVENGPAEFEDLEVSSTLWDEEHV